MNVHKQTRRDHLEKAHENTHDSQKVARHPREQTRKEVQQPGIEILDSVVRVIGDEIKKQKAD